jgi:hypothetical protein
VAVGRGVNVDVGVGAFAVCLAISFTETWVAVVSSLAPDGPHADRKAHIRISIRASLFWDIIFISPPLFAYMPVQRVDLVMKHRIHLTLSVLL